MAKKPNLRVRARRQKTAPALKRKALPRGRPFPRGNSFGAEFRFVKNVCPNAGGRAKSSEISKALRRLLASDKPIAVDSLTGAERIAWQWYRQASAGSLPAIVSLADRTEGRPAISIGVSEEGPKAMQTLIESVERLHPHLGHPEAFIPRPGLPSADVLEGELVNEEKEEDDGAE